MGMQFSIYSAAMQNSEVPACTLKQVPTWSVYKLSIPILMHLIVIMNHFNFLYIV